MATQTTFKLQSSTVSVDELRIIHRVIDVDTCERLEFINVTDLLNEIVGHSCVSAGLVHVQSLHTTAGVLIGEWQSSLMEDAKTFLSQLVRRDGHWRHNDPLHSDCERKNADSHMRGLLIGQSLSLQIRDSRVLLGTWQNVVMAEFDGPRVRSLSVEVFGI